MLSVFDVAYHHDGLLGAEQETCALARSTPTQKGKSMAQREVHVRGVSPNRNDSWCIRPRSRPYWVLPLS